MELLLDVAEMSHMRVLILFFLGAFANGLPSCAASGSGACCFWMAPKTKAQPSKQSGGGGKKAKQNESEVPKTLGLCLHGGKVVLQLHA